MHEYAKQLCNAFPFLRYVDEWEGRAGHLQIEFEEDAMHFHAIEGTKEYAESVAAREAIKLIPSTPLDRKGGTGISYRNVAAVRGYSSFIVEVKLATWRTQIDTKKVKT